MILPKLFPSEFCFLLVIKLEMIMSSVLGAVRSHKEESLIAHPRRDNGHGSNAA